MQGPNCSTKAELAKQILETLKSELMCGNKHLPLAERKTVSLFHLGVGVERRNIFNCKNPHILIYILTTADFWKIVEDAFLRPRNTTFNRQVFLITKQLRGETVVHFYEKHKKLSENCNSENKQETLVRNVFINNLINLENDTKGTSQANFSAETSTRSSNKYGTGLRRQRQIQENNKCFNLASVNTIHYSTTTRASNWSLSNNFHTQGKRPPVYCSNCDEICSLFRGTNALSGRCIAVGYTFLLKFVVNKRIKNLRTLRNSPLIT